MALKVLTDVEALDKVWSRPVPASQAIIATGDYKTTDPTPVEVTPPLSASTLMVVLDITAQTGAGNTVTLNIEVWDPAKLAFVAVGTAPTFAVGGATTNRVIVTPWMVPAAGPPITLQSVLGQTMRIRPVGSGTRTTLNYTVSAHWTD